MEKFSSLSPLSPLPSSLLSSLLLHAFFSLMRRNDNRNWPRIRRMVLIVASVEMCLNPSFSAHRRIVLPSSPPPLHLHLLPSPPPLPLPPSPSPFPHTTHNTQHTTHNTHHTTHSRNVANFSFAQKSQPATMVSHARTVAQRREQRQRAEARFAGRLCKMVELRHQVFAPSHALLRVVADYKAGAERPCADAGTQTERVSERIIMEQTFDVPAPRDIKPPEIEYVAPAPAVTRRRRQAKRAAPPHVPCAASILGIEYVPPAPAGICAAPVTEHAASDPAVTDTALAPVCACVAQAPAVTHATPPRVIEPVTPAPAVAHATARVIEHVATEFAALKAAFSSMIEYVSAVLVVTKSAPAPATEYGVPVPGVT